MKTKLYTSSVVILTLAALYLSYKLTLIVARALRHDLGWFVEDGFAIVVYLAGLFLAPVYLLGCFRVSMEITNIAFRTFGVEPPNPKEAKLM